MIEAHGGDLEISHSPEGVAIQFTIPTVPSVLSDRG